jgi:hypothetical protein
MNATLAKSLLALGAVLFFSGAAAEQQKLPVGHATDFTSEQYFEPPNERQLKLRLTGSEALPLPNGWQDIRNLKIETFDVDGKAGMIVHAPQCNYSLFDGVADSSGHLDLDSGDGKLHVEGEGFLWRQAGNSLIISNHVHTVILGGKIEL